MSGKYFHCKADGKACLSLAGEKTADDVAVMPYEDGMRVIVRAELPNGVRRCTTVEVSGMGDDIAKPIVDLAGAGDGAKVVSCVVKEGLLSGRPRLQNTPQADEDSDLVGVGMPGEEVVADAEYDDDGGTPAELWVSGVKNAPSALPDGNIPFLPMQKQWYEAIECGDKRVEYRKQCPKFRKWFIEQHPAAVKLQVGYTNRQMIWEVAGSEDCGADGIEIHLGKRIC